MSLLSAIAKFDSWQNVITGLGIAGRDRAVSTVMQSSELLDVTTLAALYRHDDICRKIVSIYPAEALRRGIPVADEGAAAALKRLNARGKITEAATWGRLYGGGVIVMGVNDGRPCDAPLAPGKWPIDFLDVYDRRSLTLEHCYERIQGQDVKGAPQIIRVNPPEGDQFRVHRSRCLVFGGATTGAQEKFQNAGWDDSVLLAPYAVIQQFANGHLAVGNMLSDASTSVFTIKGLAALVTARTESKEAVRRRFDLLDLFRSTTRSVLLDADGGESFNKLATQFADVPNVLDKLAVRLAAAAEIPVTVLMGMSPAGLNATGDADIRNWYASVEAYRTHEISPRVARLLSIIAPEATVEWPDLWTPTAAERSTTAKTVAETDQIYIDNGIFTPEEIQAKRRNYR